MRLATLHFSRYDVGEPGFWTSVTLKDGLAELTLQKAVPDHIVEQVFALVEGNIQKDQAKGIEAKR